MLLNSSRIKGSSNPTDAEKIIQKLMTFRQQMQIYHWQTPSYARHKAADELLEKLTEFTDKFMEIYFGKYGKINMKSPINITLNNMNDTQGAEYLDVMQTYFEDKLTTYLDSKDSDLVNLRDEILAATKQAKYLYTLQ